MAPDNTLAIIAIVLSLIALIGLAYVYVEYTPETTDLSGVETDVSNLENSVKSLSMNILDIDTDCECDIDISDGDIEDLEDYANEFRHIEENQEDIKELQDKCTCEDGTPCDMTIVNANTVDIETLMNCLGDVAEDISWEDFNECIGYTPAL